MDKAIMDEITYKAFQKLKYFVEFIGNLEYVKEGEKNFILYIIEAIENLNKPDETRNADISLDIFDYKLRDRETDRTGVYWRTWFLYIQKNCIEVGAESCIDDVPPDDIETKHFYLDYYLSFDDKYYTPLTSVDFFDELIEDVKNYKSYITEHLKDIVIDIS